MKRNRYTLALCLFSAATLFLSTAALAQPGYYRHGHGYGYGHGYVVKYYPTPYYPPRVYYYNHPYVSLNFGGTGYRYQEGYYYRPYGPAYKVVVPPFGIRIATLPIGYSSFYIGPTPYYYYGGVYYRPYPGNQYEVVKPPLGAVVHKLPDGAKATVIDGKKYYEQNGTYYEESINEKNKLEYTVVGTDGVLNTTNGPTNNDRVDNGNQAQPSGPSVGDRFDDLPGDSKAVVINGQKLYLSPSGLYYKEVIDGNKLSYEVVGQ